MSVTMSSHNNNASDEVIQWVTFKLDSEIYGINVMQVQEVLRLPEIAPVPGAPIYVMGIINLRGNVVTVIDTRNRFGLAQKEPDDATRIIITEDDKQVIGMLVDAVAEVVNLKGSEIETTPNLGEDNESSKYIQGVHSRGDEILILIDVDKMLSESELDAMGGF
jgi:purine-binding chemotaxis protein CheW